MKGSVGHLLECTGNRRACIRGERGGGGGEKGGGGRRGGGGGVGRGDDAAER